MEQVPLDAAAMLTVLEGHEVRYVIIGGVAGFLHGDTAATFDLDVVPAATEDNFARLADALNAMHAGLRAPGLDEPVAYRFDAATFVSYTTLATRTEHGDLDIVLRPDGIAGSYDELAIRAQPMHAGPIMVYVAAVADIIRSKRAAAQMTGEPKYTSDADRLERLLTDDPTLGRSDGRDTEARDRDRFRTDPPGRGRSRGLDR
jgi:hypothetical protein